MATKEDPAVQDGLEPLLSGFADHRAKERTKPPSHIEDAPDPPETRSGLRHIVVCLDRSAPGEAALPFAYALARTMEARITLLHVLDPGHTVVGQPVPAGALDWEFSRIEARQYLEEIRAGAERDDFDVRTALVQGSAAQQIVQFAWETRADLVVLASHGERGLDQWNLGSTAQKVVSYCSTSVLAVPCEFSRHAKGTIRFRKIMAALDGSLRSECALPTAERLALDHGAELVLSHVVPKPELTLPAPPTEEDFELVNALHRRNRRVAEQYLSRLSSRLAGRGIRVGTVLEERGETSRTLKRVSEREEIDLTILSAHGSAGSSERLHGSVIQHLVADLATPLLVLQDLPREDLRRLTETRFVRTAPRPTTAPSTETRP